MDRQVSDIGVHAFTKLNIVSLWTGKCLTYVCACLPQDKHCIVIDKQVSGISCYAYTKINSVLLWIGKCLTSVCMPTPR